jgi:hypothetical protein
MRTFYFGHERCAAARPAAGSLTICGAIFNNDGFSLPAADRPESAASAGRKTVPAAGGELTAKILLRRTGCSAGLERLRKSSALEM